MMSDKSLMLYLFFSSCFYFASLLEFHCPIFNCFILVSTVLVCKWNFLWNFSVQLLYSLVQWLLCGPFLSFIFLKILYVLFFWYQWVPLWPLFWTLYQVKIIYLSFIKSVSGILLSFGLKHVFFNFFDSTLVSELDKAATSTRRRRDPM